MVIIQRIFIDEMNSLISQWLFFFHEQISLYFGFFLSQYGLVNAWDGSEDWIDCHLNWLVGTMMLLHNNDWVT